MPSMMLITRELLPYMNKKDGASIINMASLAGEKVDIPVLSFIPPHKGAVLTWTRALSNELGPEGHPCQCHSPRLY